MKLVRTPGLRQVFDLFGALGNLVIERQDKWVVATQRPYRTELRMGEKLIPGDGPIVLYRRRLPDDLRKRLSGDLSLCNGFQPGRPPVLFTEWVGASRVV